MLATISDFDRIPRILRLNIAAASRVGQLARCCVFVCPGARQLDGGSAVVVYSRRSFALRRHNQHYDHS